MSEEILKQLIKRVELIEAALFGAPATSVEKPEKRKVSKKVKRQHITIPPILDQIPNSELVEITKHKLSSFLSPEELAKITIQIPRSDLISAIEGDIKLSETIVDPVGEIREKIFKFINNHEILKSDLVCSTYCPTCPYSRVINCFSVNRRRIENDTSTLKL